MTDLKRRSLVAALGAAPFAVPLLTRRASARDKIEVQKHTFSREDQATIFSKSRADHSRGTQSEVLR